MNKNKILNDPVYGFINIPGELIFDVIEHPFFQRLRRIKQLGLTDLVYPGANHTRFHHALGAMHLMGEALKSLQSKGVEISEEEFESTLIAILLHDLGHGPFSHALEHSILKDTPHEQLSLVLMKRINEEMDGALDVAIKIFNNTYKRPFFHELVSGQLDIDRMDYLQRDCFFTGVSEGAIGADRIIKMLDVHNDKLVVEEKGIYSVENFLNARRLMYWQVYLHKASISAEQMLISIFKRAKFLSKNELLDCPIGALNYFLSREVTSENLVASPEALINFTLLDDNDVWTALKLWTSSRDHVLSILCTRLVQRRLFRIKMSNDPVDVDLEKEVKKKVKDLYNLTEEELEYFILKGDLTNAAYISQGKTINIKTKSGKVVDIALASELPNIKAISKIVRKHYISWPKDVYL